jgi:pimeloyl-ACP methyl ester carboxylesterase
METVVLLHCSGSSGAQWRSLTAQLDGYRVIAPDLMHQGTLAGEAAAVSSLIEEPIHLVGHSYGGAVALHIARTRPDLLKTLTLVEPSAFHLLRHGDRTDAAALREITAVADNARAALAAGDDMGGYGRFVEYWTGEKRAPVAPQLDKIVRDFDALLGEPAELEDVAGIDVPTLIVQGGCTKLPSRCVCARLRTALPQAAFHLVQGAGHMLPLTHREQVNDLIAAHLKEKPCNRAMPSASRYRSASAGRSTAM